MADEFADEIARAAEKAVAMCAARGSAILDYSESSLSVVEDMLSEAAAFTSEMTPDEINTLVQDFGCYVLAIGRREFAGRYLWHEERDQPILVVGEPKFRVAMMAWDRVRGRLSGDAADNIPFFYDGFAGRARQAVTGTDALYV